MSIADECKFGFYYIDDKIQLRDIKSKELLIEDEGTADGLYLKPLMFDLIDEAVEFRNNPNYDLIDNRQDELPTTHVWRINVIEPDVLKRYENFKEWLDSLANLFKRPSSIMRIDEIEVNQLNNVDLSELKSGHFRVNNSEKVIDFQYFPSRQPNKRAVFFIDEKERTVDFVMKNFKDCTLTNINTKCIGDELVGCTKCPPYCYGE